MKKSFVRGMSILLCLVFLSVSHPVRTYAADGDMIVYITPTGIKYHLGSCRYANGNYPITLQDAINRGYTACGVCDPPGTYVPTTRSSSGGSSGSSSGGSSGTASSSSNLPLAVTATLPGTLAANDRNIVQNEKEYTVNTSSSPLNVRAEPSSIAALVGTLQKGTRFHSTHARKNGSTIEWVYGYGYAGNKKITGWVSAQFLKENSQESRSAAETSSASSGNKAASTGTAAESSSASLDNLSWTIKNKQHLLYLSDAQMDQLSGIAVNVCADDGEGYIDLGLDDFYRFSDDGALIGDTDGTWVALNGQVIPYYSMGNAGTASDYSYTGATMALINGEMHMLIIIFDKTHPDGYVAGYTDDLDESVSLYRQLAKGDVIQPVCEYYNYQYEYDDLYLFGEEIKITGAPEISYVSAGDRLSVRYCLTDLNGEDHYTPRFIENW